MTKHKEAIEQLKKLFEDFKIERENPDKWHNMSPERIKEFDTRLLNIGILDNKITEKKDGFYFGEINLGADIETIASNGIDMIVRENIIIVISTKDISSEFNQ